MPQDGVIRVEDLLRSPALQLRLIAGESGTSRRVAWAHVSELEDPTPWLFGAEMIMTTGIAVPRGAERQRAYLALSEGLMVPPLSRGFLATADERGFPVVEVPIPVPFMAIAQQVAAAVQGDTGQRLNAQLQVFGAVQWLAAGNLSAREIFARLERLSGYTLYACTLQRGPLLDGVPVPPPESAHLIPGTASSPPTVPGGYVLPVSGPRGTVGYVLALESPDATPAGVSVVQHIATVAALQLSMLAHEREMLRREGAETLAEMLQGLLDQTVVARRLAAKGFTPGRALLLAVVRPRQPSADVDSVAGALAGAGLPHLILRQRPTGPPRPCASTRIRCFTGCGGSSRSVAARLPRPNRWPRSGWPCAPPPPRNRTSKEQAMTFVPEDFEVPTGLVTGQFRLEPLGPQHNEGDYAAWTSSMEHIRATPGFEGRSWPHPMTAEENLDDLRRHAGDFAARTGFTYTVLDGDGGEVIGCLYIYPVESGEGADVRSWVTADRAGLDAPLHAAVSSWLKNFWPFEMVTYPPR